MREPSSGTSNQTRRSLGAQPLVLWAALAVALSPSLAELLQHWTREAWARESGVFVPLAIASAVADPARRRPNRVGWLLVAIGIGLALFGSAAGLASLGRLAIPLAVLGMAYAIGHPSPRVALIALFVIPPPFGIVSIGSPAGERILAHAAVDAERALGGEWAAGDATVRTAKGDLRLGAPDLGIPLAHLLAGLGFCAGIAGGDSALRAGLRGVLWAAWALPAQLLALIAAFALLGVAGADAARALLEIVPACAIVAIAMPQLGAQSPRRMVEKVRIASTS